MHSDQLLKNSEGFLTCMLEALSRCKYTLGDVPPLLHMLPLPCSPNKSFKFSDLPTISTAEIRTENRAPVLYEIISIRCRQIFSRIL